MRRLVLLATLACLTACSGEDAPKGIDAANLPPLTGTEKALLLAADSALQQGNGDAAEKDYQSAISASTGHVEAHAALAQLYVKKNKIGKAEEVISKALEWQPNNPGINYLAGKIALSKGNPAAALTAFTNGLSSAPNDLDLINGAGISNDMLGKHAAAQALYKPALTRTTGPSATPLRTNLAMSYLMSGNAKAALPLLQKEAKTPEASPVIHHNLALAYGLLGNEAMAKRSMGLYGDETTRIATLAKLKAYLADTSPTKTPPSLSSIATVSAVPVLPVQ